MVYIKNFGWRLGNQLFQIAAGYALAKKNRDELVIPTWSYAKHFRGPFIMGDDSSIFTYSQGDNFHHQDIPYRRDLAIDGYYQSEKFFCCMGDEIRSLFAMNPNSSVREEVEQNAEQIAKCGMTCSVHIRRGDYLNYPNHHPTLSPEWYANAMRQFHPDTVFWVFSDDIAWVKENIHAPNVCYQHSSDISDFFTQSLCSHHIIANSSFSWWAAWLNPSYKKRVIAPARWFGPAYGHYNINDLYPKEWIKL